MRGGQDSYPCVGWTDVSRGFQWRSSWVRGFDWYLLLIILIFVSLFASASAFCFVGSACHHNSSHVCMALPLMVPCTLVALPLMMPYTIMALYLMVPYTPMTLPIAHCGAIYSHGPPSCDAMHPDAPPPLPPWCHTPWWPSPSWVTPYLVNEHMATLVHTLPPLVKNELPHVYRETQCTYKHSAVWHRKLNPYWSTTL